VSCEDSFVGRFSSALRRSGVAFSSHSRPAAAARRCFAPTPRTQRLPVATFLGPEQPLRENAVEATELRRMESVKPELPVAYFAWRVAPAPTSWDLVMQCRVAVQAGASPSGGQGLPNVVVADSGVLKRRSSSRQRWCWL
jgi:hypothetical protein